MVLARGTVQALLLDAYRRRDQVGLIAFAGAGARLILPPTSVDLAQRRLSRLSVGGRTPSPPGSTWPIRPSPAGPAPCASPPHPSPLLVLVTDGRASAAPHGLDPWGARPRAPGGCAGPGSPRPWWTRTGRAPAWGSARPWPAPWERPYCALAPVGPTGEAAPALAGHLRRLAGAAAPTPPPPRWV